MIISIIFMTKLLTIGKRIVFLPYISAYKDVLAFLNQNMSLDPSVNRAFILKSNNCLCWL